MFKRVREEVKSQVISKGVDNLSSHIVDIGKEKVKEVLLPIQTQVTSQQSDTKLSTDLNYAISSATKAIGEVAPIKNTIEEEINMKLHSCVAFMSVTFFVGFFTQLEYVKPIHPILSIPVFSIFAFSTCWYIMRYLTKEIKTRCGIIVFSGLFVGALARYMSIKLGQYRYITEDQPLMLFPLLAVCIGAFICVFRYIFEISKKHGERWKMFKTD